MIDDSRNNGKDARVVSYADNPEVGHEESDVRIKPIAWFIFWLMAATAVICVLIAFLFNWFERREQKAEGRISPLASERNDIPPAPLLQLAPKDAEQLKRNMPPDFKNDHPLAEMKSLLEEERRRLSSYTWIDQQKGIVSIPIEDAKRLLLQKGALQFRKQAPQNGESQNGESQNGESQNGEPKNAAQGNALHGETKSERNEKSAARAGRESKHQ
jgi:hypothetical protein